MDGQFRSIYEYEYRSYGAELDARQRELAERTKKVVDFWTDEVFRSRVVRPDARLFLLVNLHRMLVMPLTESRSMDQDEVYARLEHDTGTIVRYASASASRNQEEEISSHRVVDAVSQTWDDLELTRESIWM